MFLSTVIVLLTITIFVMWSKNRRLNILFHNKIRETEKNNTIFNSILKNIQAYILIINRDFVVLETNYYAITGSKAPDKQIKIGELFHCKQTIEGNECGKGELCPTCPIRHRINQSFDSKTNFHKIETIFQRFSSDNNEAIYNVFISGSYLPIPQDNPTLLLTIHDITELKQVQTELQIEKEKAQKSEKRKLTFLSNLGHEIRTPLNSIIGLTELIVEDQELSYKERKNYISIINNNSEMLQHLIDDMLILSRIESDRIQLNLSKFDICKFCHEIVIHRNRFSPPGVSFYFEHSTEEIEIKSDQIKLAQILLNLISNAQKFTEEGHIRFHYDLKEDGNIIEFLLEDTGKGITTENLINIFERFNKASDFTQGTGLGLPICKAYVEALGGKIEIKSEINKGTEILFSIKNYASLQTVSE